MFAKATQLIFRERNAVKPVLSGHSKIRPKLGFQDRLLLNADQKYFRMLQREHSAILSTFIKLPFVIKTFLLSIFEWPLKTGFTVLLQTVKTPRYRMNAAFHEGIYSVC